MRKDRSPTIPRPIPPEMAFNLIVPGGVTWCLGTRKILLAGLNLSSFVVREIAIDAGLLEV